MPSRDDLILYTITSDATLRIFLPVLDAPQRLQLHASLDVFTTLPFSLASQIKTSKSQQSKRIKLEASVPLTKDTLNKATRDQDKLAVIASPESSLSSNCDGVLTFADAITGRTSLSSGHRTHVPYFRYFGPTAIVPGFKQMV